MAAYQLRVFGYVDAENEWPRSTQENTINLLGYQNELRSLGRLGTDLHLLDRFCK